MWKALWAVLSVGRWCWVVWKSKLSKPGATRQEKMLLHGLYFSSCFQVPLLSSCPDFPHNGLLPESTRWNKPIPLQVTFGHDLYHSRRNQTRTYLYSLSHLTSPRFCTADKTSKLMLIILWYQGILACLEIFSNLINLKWYFSPPCRHKWFLFPLPQDSKQVEVQASGMACMCIGPASGSPAAKD